MILTLVAMNDLLRQAVRMAAKLRRLFGEHKSGRLRVLPVNSEESGQSGSPRRSEQVGTLEVHQAGEHTGTSTPTAPAPAGECRDQVPASAGSVIPRVRPRTKEDDAAEEYLRQRRRQRREAARLAENARLTNPEATPVPRVDEGRATRSQDRNHDASGGEARGQKSTPPTDHDALMRRARVFLTERHIQLLLRAGLLEDEVLFHEQRRHLVPHVMLRHGPPPLPENGALPRPNLSTDGERGRDLAEFARERGKFGSLPSHDDHGDEAQP